MWMIHLRNFLVGAAALVVIVAVGMWAYAGNGRPATEATIQSLRQEAVVLREKARQIDARIAPETQTTSVEQQQIAVVPPASEAQTPPTANDNWTPPVEPEGVVRHAKQTPPTLYGANDSNGQSYCDKYDHGKVFKGWVGKGLQRHAFCV